MQSIAPYFVKTKPLGVGNSGNGRSKAPPPFEENRSMIRKLFFLRTGVFLLLGCLIAVVGSISFLLLRKVEHQNFDQVYDSSVEQISTSIDRNLRAMLGATDVLNNIYAYAIRDGYAGKMPFVTLPGYQDIVTTLGSVTGARDIAFDPILTNKTRKAWENYARTQVKNLQIPSHLLGSINGTIQKGCWSPGEGKPYSKGYMPEGDYPDLVLPIWQISSINESYGAMMLDVYSQDGGTAVIDRVISSKKPAFTDMIQLVEDAYTRPSTILYSPVVDLDTKEVVGLTDLAFSWDTAVSQALPSYISGIICIIATSTQEFSLLLQHGQVHVVGKGDSHQKDFAKYRRVITASLTTLASISASDYTITIYPTTELYDKYITTTPAIVCGSFVAIIVFAALVVVVYDRLRTKRDEGLRGAVETTTKITNLTLQELEVKKEFVRYISHEIRTPLSTVKMGLDLLREEVEKGKGKRSLKGTIEDITQSCQAALEVVNDFLLFDKIISDSLTLDLTTMNIVSFIEESMKPFYIQARQSCVTLILMNDLPGVDCNEKNLNINIDRHKMTQVMRNLLSNALKFTPRNGRIMVKLSKTENMLGDLDSNNHGEFSSMERTAMYVIEVIDNGVGISQENQQKLFREVVQFNAGELQAGGGSGLGMYISHGIMKQHGGILNVYSEGEGKGSTFTIQIPNKKALSVTEFFRSPSFSQGPTPGGAGGAVPQLRRQSSIKTVNNSELESKYVWDDNRTDCDVVEAIERDVDSEAGVQEKTRVRALVVDDSVMNRKMLIRSMSSSDNSMKFEEACNGKEAVDKVKSKLQQPQKDYVVTDFLDDATNTYDVILMDYVMPVMSGPEAVKQIRELGYNGLIIGVTAHAAEHETNVFLSQGADRVMVKPVNIKALTEIIEGKNTESEFTL